MRQILTHIEFRNVKVYHSFPARVMVQSFFCALIAAASLKVSNSARFSDVAGGLSVLRPSILSAPARSSSSK